MELRHIDPHALFHGGGTVWPGWMGGAGAVGTVDQLEPKGQNQASPLENVNCLDTMR
jgi:hypothetical protein